MRSLVLASLIVVGSFAGQAAPPKGRTGMFRGAYDAPKNPAHQPIFDRLRGMRILQRFAAANAFIRLPRPLLLRFAGCDGTSNAWYDEASGTITFCYEYVAEIDQIAAGAAGHGIEPSLASEGAVVFILLHETAHGLFHLLKAPILGREEDAADQVAALMLLRAGEGLARPRAELAAWMYLHDARGRMPDESDFADVHGLDAQRYYNVLCMAHGSDPEAFQGMVDKGYLPKERAEVCADEFRQVAYAVTKLIDPSVDAALAEEIKAAHKARWEAPRKLDPPPATVKH